MLYRIMALVPPALMLLTVEAIARAAVADP